MLLGRVTARVIAWALTIAAAGTTVWLVVNRVNCNLARLISDPCRGIRTS